MQTQMPPGASESSSRHLSRLSKLIHEMFTSDETGKLLNEADPQVKNAAYDSFDASLVRVARRDYDKAKKLPTELVAEITRVAALAHNIWANEIGRAHV